MSEDICDSCGTLKECIRYSIKGELFVWCDECKEEDDE
jgi:hypothetical protein